MKKIKEFFSQSKVENEKLLVNLTKDRWVNDNEIVLLFRILNKQCDEAMCVVCTPDKYANDFLKSKSKDFTNGKVLLAHNVGKVLLAHNVGQDKSIFIADGVRQGNHWTLLAVDVKEKTLLW